MPTGNLNAKLHVRWTRPGTINLWALAGRHRGSLNASRAKFRLMPQSCRAVRAGHLGEFVRDWWLQLSGDTFGNNLPPCRQKPAPPATPFAD